jgi:hypothetical protein
MHRIELLGDMGYLESRFGLFGESVSVGARQVHGLRQTYRRLILGAPDGTPWFEAQVEAHFSSFRDRANLDPR